MTTERWVCLDVGETIIDETRVWSTWADELGVPRLTFLAACGAVIERGGEHRDVFPMVTGDAIDSADTLKGFWELRELINTRYWLASTIEDFDIYLEK